MSSFEFDVSEKDAAGSEHISKVSRQLIAAFVRKSRAERITKAALADKLGLDKSTVGRMLRGNSNLTLRSVGELCWALNVQPDFVCKDFVRAEGGNDHPVVRIVNAFSTRPHLAKTSAQAPSGIRDSYAVRGTGARQ